MWCRSWQGLAYLEERMVNVWEAEHPDIDQCLLVMLILCEKSFEAVHCSAGLGHDLSQYIDINLGALDHIVI